jgi:hypothetical protein
MTINLSNVNEAPVNHVPSSSQLVYINHSLIFIPGTGNAISVSDPDTGTVLIQVNLAVLHGTLTLGATSGLTFGAGDGHKNRSMIFRGTIAAVNTALNGLSYAPVRGYVGSETMTIATDDLGSGIGSSLVDSDSVSIQVHDKKAHANAAVHRAVVKGATVRVPGVERRMNKSAASSLSAKHTRGRHVIATATHAPRARTAISNLPKTAHKPPTRFHLAIRFRNLEKS